MKNSPRRKISRLIPCVALAAAVLALPGLSRAGSAFLLTSDGSGISSLTVGTNWSIAGAPSAANDYYTSNFFVRTPTGSGSVTFGGNSLTLQPPAGQASAPRSMLFKGGNGYVVIINNLTNAGGLINLGSGATAVPTFTGNLMTVVSNSTIQADQASLFIGYPLAGSADLTNTSGNATTITYTNNNSAFTGRLVINNNVTVAFTSRAGAPGNPAVPTPSQIDLGAGCTLLDNAGIFLTNANGGVTLEGNATINVSSNTMLVSEPITDNGNNYSLVKRGGAILTLAAANTFGGGLSLYGITAGSQLNINNPYALGTGTFTINNGNNGVIDNTSGGPIVNANNNAETWQNSFAFIGSQNLNLGGGAVTMTGSLTVTVSNNNLTVGPLTDNGAAYALTKAGAGTLTINGGATYSGNTTVSGGSLVVTGGSAPSSGTFTVTTNATLDVSGAGGLNLPGNGILSGGTVNGSVTDNGSTTIYPGGNGTIGTLTVNGNLTLNGAGTVAFDLSSATTAAGGANNDLVVVTGTLNLANPNTTLALTGIPVVGTYTLFQYGTFAGSLANLSVPPGYTLNNDSAAHAIELVVTNVPASLTWVGGAAGSTWDQGTTPAWRQGATTGVDFFTGDAVTFDDTGTGGSLYVAVPVSPVSTTVSAAQTYDFYGSGIVTGSLTKNGVGTLILENSNSYAGPTVINGGLVQLGNGGNTGSLGTGPVTNNGILVVYGSTTANFAGPILGSGSLTNLSGDSNLAASNSYTGLTTVTGGRILARNANALGATNSGTVVSSGGQVYLVANVNYTAEALTLNGFGGDGNGALRKGAAGVSLYPGSITLASDSSIDTDSGATLILTNAAGIVATNNNLTFGGGAGTNTVIGPITLGTGGLTINVGMLTLNSVDSYTGGTTLSAGIVNALTNGAFGPGEILANGSSGRIVLGTGTTLTNFVDAATVAPGVATGFLMVNDNTNGSVTTISGPLEFDATAANGNDFVGPTSSGYLNVTGAITNNVTGTIGSRNGFVRFSGGGSYTSFVLNQGTVSLGGNNGLCTNAALSMSVSASSTLDLNGFNQTLTGLTDGAATPNVELVTNSSAATRTLTLALSGGDTYSGVIGGNLSLVVSGSGNLLLAGTNTYTGNTTINGGTLELAQPAFALSSQVAVASGAFLQLDYSVTNQIFGLTLGGVSQPAGLYDNTTSPGFINGSGYLLVQPVATNPTNLLFHVSGSTLTLSWPADHAGWILQTETNALNTGLSNNWVDVPGSGSQTQTSITINPATPTEFFRLRSPN